MAGQKRAARERRQSREIMRILKFGAIPLIVILLIAVIIAADRGGKKEESDPLSWAESPEAGAPLSGSHPVVIHFRAEILDYGIPRAGFHPVGILTGYHVILHHLVPFIIDAMPPQLVKSIAGGDI